MVVLCVEVELALDVVMVAWVEIIGWPLVVSIVVELGFCEDVIVVGWLVDGWARVDAGSWATAGGCGSPRPWLMTAWTGSMLTSSPVPTASQIRN